MYRWSNDQIAILHRRSQKCIKVADYWTVDQEDLRTSFDVSYGRISINRRVLTLRFTSKVKPHCGTRGGVEGIPPPRVFDMLQYFETISPSVKSLWSSLRDEVYFMGGGAAEGLWRHQTRWPFWLPSCILSRIRNQVKTVRINIFWAQHVK